MEFRLDIPVRFNDIDGAGSVDSPTLSHYYHLTFGFPTVHVEGDFDAPVRHGDSLTVALSVPRAGSSSATCRGSDA